jgi:exodeoxyribonuclease VII large subunit
MLARQRFTALSIPQIQNRLQTLIGRRNQRLDELRHRLETAISRRLRTRTTRIATLAALLERQNPTTRLTLARRRLDRATESLRRFAATTIAARTARLTQASARLHALSPIAVLNRGYALVYIEDGSAAGQLLRDAANAQPGQSIHARLAKGSLTADVKSTTSE